MALGLTLDKIIPQPLTKQVFNYNVLEIKLKLWMILITQVLVTCSAYSQIPPSPHWTSLDALERFAASYEKDISAIEPLSFGVEVNGDRYLVNIRDSNGALAVDVSEGFGSEQTFFFKTDAETLAKIDMGVLHGLTAMAQTRANDPAPMTLEFMEGFTPTNPSVFQSTFLSVAFHFWTRETPETVKLDETMSRVVHGANAVGIFYDPDLHSAWYHVKQGQHVNADPKDQTNDHPSMFIFTNGIGHARIDGVERQVAADEAILVPEGVAHEFWNSHEEALEFIIVMWGFEK